MAKRRVTIEQWITQALADGDKAKPCSALSLVHVKTSGVGVEEIHTKQLTGPVNPRELAELFISRATGFAQDLPGVQTFRMLAFYGSNEPQNAFPFTVADGELTGGDIPYAKHEPTNAGLLGQMMKHNEQMMALCMDLVKTVAVQAVQREDQMRQEVQQAQMIVRDVVFNMKKEEHAMRMEALQFQRTTEERRMLAHALPTVANHLMGREVMPEAMADTALIDGLAMKVKPEHLQALVGIGLVDEREAAVLAARFTKTVEQRKREIEAAKMAPPEENEKEQVT